MGAAEEIAACEAALRELIRTVDGTNWTSGFPDDQIARFEQTRADDQKRRRGTLLSNDLLDYVQLYHLKKYLLGPAWSRYAPALGKQKYIEIYLDRLEGLRNAVAHSRPLLPFEEALVSGITGEIRNLVVIHRNSENLDQELWPVIEEARDSFGATRTHSQPHGPWHEDQRQLQPGDQVTFTVRGRDAEGAQLTWRCGRWPTDGSIGVITGDEAEFVWTVEQRDIGANSTVTVTLIADRDDHRRAGFDATVEWSYFVTRPRTRRTD
jgi:hypothetical protein